MSRLPTASEIKNGRTNGRVAGAYPTPGTLIGNLCDEFLNAKAQAVRINDRECYHRIAALCDRYGLDIRLVGPRQWMLVGEWIDGVYHDYLAEALEEESDG